MIASSGGGRPARDIVRLAGLASGVIPLAVVVHVVAELVASAPTTCAEVLLRHVYMVPLVVAAAAAFAWTVGLGTQRREFVRRAALARAVVQRVGVTAGVRDLFLANLAFFAVTQLLEGVPIAAGSVAIALMLATFGSLVAAFVVFALGRTVAIVIVAALAARADRAAPLRIAVRSSGPTRRASRIFSLSMPSRPPPRESFA